MEYYINQNGVSKGPFTVEELKRFRISTNTLVSNQNGEGWIDAWKVSELKECIDNQPQANTVNTQQQCTNNHTEPRPKTWLVEAILSTLLCCLPFGVVSIIYSSKVEGYYMQHEYEEARKASKSAKIWFYASLFSAIGAWLIYVIFMVFFVALGVGSSYLY